MALSKILYSAGGFQDFLNSVKNAVLMPENAKKIIKKLATRWSHVLGPILIDDFHLTIYLFIDMKNSKSKEEEKISNFSSCFLCRMSENGLGEIQ